MQTTARKNSVLALGAAASLAAAGLLAPHADAVAARSALHVTVRPTKPSAGQNLRIKATNANKGQTYVCITTLVHRGVKESASLANTSNVEEKKANSRGVVKCQIPFLPFTKTYKGKKISCPPTRANKRKGWGCGAAAANLHHRSQFKIARFKF